MFDYSKVRGKIAEVFESSKNFADAMGMSERTLSLKLNNKIDWKQSEIVKAMKLFGLGMDVVSDYFFVLAVHKCVLI